VLTFKWHPLPQNSCITTINNPQLYFKRTRSNSHLVVEQTLTQASSFHSGMLSKRKLTGASQPPSYWFILFLFPSFHNDLESTSLSCAPNLSTHQCSPLIPVICLVLSHSFPALLRKLLMLLLLESTMPLLTINSTNEPSSSPAPSQVVIVDSVQATTTAVVLYIYHPHWCY
jgi:hypothetical protein